MKTKKRFLSLLLSICLVVGVLPAAAFAAVTDTGKAIQLVDSAAAANIGGKQADNIYFGTYKQSSSGSGYNLDPIKWRVLSNSGGQLFLLSDQNLDVFQYHTEQENVTWETSTMRSWLNGYGAASNIGGDSGTDYTNDNFLDNAFSGKEQTAIAETAVVNDANTDYGTDGGNNTNDRIFLLSIDETYNRNYFPKDANRLSTNTEYVAAGGKLGSNMYGAGEADWWWLRSPGFDNSRAAFMEWEDCAPVADGNPVNNNTAAVRPAFNLNLNSVLFTSAASGGKDSGTVGTLSAVPQYNSNEWKLTILDTSRNSFAANVNGQSSVSASAGGSINIAYSSAQTGTNEYVSVLLCNSSGSVLYYGNIAQNSASGTATLSIPVDLTAGVYTLKVYSEQLNGDRRTDYASAFREISLNVLSKATTPQAVFTATDDNSGTLSNVDTSMKYSTDGGLNWTDITGTTINISGVTVAKGIQVVRKGDNTTTSDSAPQIFDVTQAAKPGGVGKTDCTTTAQNDGTITNVNNTMEYRLSTASGWTKITGTGVTGLANGTYYVRVMANGTVLASDAATVIIGKHICTAQGNWQYNENNHWKLCGCREKLDNAAHSFVWVVDKEATVTQPGSKHEKCSVCGYAKAAVEIPAGGNTQSPQTGDDSNIALWIAVMLASGAALTGTILYSRKRKCRR